MTASPPPAPAAALVSAVRVAVVLATIFVGVQVLVVRPTAFPAGAGFTLRAGTIAGALGDPQSLKLTRPPDLSRPPAAVIADVQPGGAADLAGVRAGDLLRRVVDERGARLDLADLGSTDAAVALRAWRTAWWLDVRNPFTLTVERDGRLLTMALAPRWFPDVPDGAIGPWLRRHLAGSVHVVAMLAAAATLVALRVRGRVAAWMTLTMVVNVAVGGALVGGEAWVPSFVREPLVLFAWLLSPLGFPVVGWTVLNFPTPSSLVARWPALPWALAALAAPLVAANGLAALYLLGATALAAPLAWFAARPLLWTAAFVVALAANGAIIAEGLRRYRRNPDLNERRRIMVVVYTGVPGALAWAVSEGAPLLGTLVSGAPWQLPWPLSVLLGLLMLLPAFGLPYAVAVKQVFSPRTVLRRSLQYALAQRTLTVLTALPAVPLALSLVRQRDMSLTEIVTGRPFFYLAGIALLIVARRYRERAERRLERRFFRQEYDAREIMMSLAGRLPFETDPGELVALVIHHVDSALHPETVAVLAEVEPGRFDPIGARPAAPPPLSTSGGLATVLRWSRDPLEIEPDDERAGTSRLPAEDRAWLDAADAQLLVPLLAGDTAGPTLVGVLVLGPKRSDERYSGEDRALLSAIAAQMALGLDVSRLRRRASAAAATTPRDEDLTIAHAPTLGLCPRCERCADLSRGTCSEDGTALVAVPGLPAVVDAKYRVDARIGRGGMGAVFRARDVRLDRDVAIKVVRAELLGAPDVRARFRREAQAVARLHHPGVVAVYDYGTLPDGAAYIVMEFVPGEDLRQRLRRTPVLAPSEAVALVAGIAAGVQAAHDADVFHRDLKPENILLPAGGGPKVLDFGVAKMAAPGGGDPGRTATVGATVVGTPAYMAPEQLRGQPADGRADVFSLAVMTFEMLTGALPYGAGSFVDIGVAHAEGRVAHPERLPAAVRDVVLAALSREPDGRPPTAAAFAEALRAAARG